MNIVAQEPYSLSALDLSSVVLRIKQANPDVLALTPYVRDGILFLQQAKDAGLSPKVLICPEVLWRTMCSGKNWATI